VVVGSGWVLKAASSPPGERFREPADCRGGFARRLIVIALPDEVQPEVYNKQIAPNLRAGTTIGFLHGFNIRYGFIQRDNVG